MILVSCYLSAWLLLSSLLSHYINYLPVNGGWSEWGEWAACTQATCNLNQLKIRTRTCTIPEPALGGDYCPGLDAQRFTIRKSQASAVVGK